MKRRQKDQHRIKHLVLREGYAKTTKKKKVGTLNKRTPHTDEADAQMSAEVRGHVMKKTTLTNKFRV